MSNNKEIDEKFIRKIVVLPHLIGMVYGKGKINIIELSKEYHLDINIVRNNNDNNYFEIKLFDDEEIDINNYEQTLIATERLDNVKHIIENLIKRKSLEFHQHEQIKKKYREEKINHKYFDKSTELKDRITNFRHNHIEYNHQNEHKHYDPNNNNNNNNGLKKNPFFVLSSISEEDS
jgi:hypothetical protein